MSKTKEQRDKEFELDNAVDRALSKRNRFRLENDECVSGKVTFTISKISEEKEPSRYFAEILSNDGFEFIGGLGKTVEEALSQLLSNDNVATFKRMLFL